MFTVTINMPDGTTMEQPQEAVLEDGFCLYALDGKCYHTVCGCNGKLRGWYLTTIEDAEQKGLMPCPACEDTIKELHTFWMSDDEDDDF